MTYRMRRKISNPVFKLPSCGACGCVNSGWRRSTNAEIENADFFVAEMMDSIDFETCIQCGEVNTKEFLLFREGQNTDL